MANTAIAAGDNGVSGTMTALPADVNSGSLQGGNLNIDFGDVGDSSNGVAVRQSVSLTQGNAFTTATRSNVFSQTQGLRFAYTGVECDSPAVTRAVEA